MVNTHFVCGAFMLCNPFGVLAALRGRQLSHSDLTITSAHGQGGVSTVRQELGLYACNKRKTILLFNRRSHGNCHGNTFSCSYLEDIALVAAVKFQHGVANSPVPDDHAQVIAT